MWIETVSAASSEEGDITTWEVANGAVVASLRNNTCCAHCVAPIGKSYVVAAQKNLAKMRFWSRSKGHCVDSVLPEKCVSVCVTPEGLFLFAGGKSGRIYAWELSSGAMLSSWDAHYKAVTNLKVDVSGTMLVSGGDDAVCHVWLLPQLLDPEPGKSQLPHISWSGHTRPITDLEFVSLGTESIVVSVSMDCSCQRWSVASGALKESATFPCPLLSVAIRPGWQSIFCGGYDGCIYERPLVQDGVTSLDFTPFTEQLVSGSLDGCLRIWDVVSRQCLRVIELPGRKPVSNVFVAHSPRPSLDEDAASLTPPPVGISKFQGQPVRTPDYAWEGSLVKLNNQAAYSGIAHVFLNQESRAAPHRKKKAAEPFKVSLEDKTEDRIGDTEMVDAMNSANLDIKSLVSQVLSDDRTM